uniref:Uncharacterized protein n=1 Tax=Vespula pensylvanica TaxID=30213 RepID=A0A834K457_VESPE|nr:hypothetical protein H0235_016483 [Vespula pensylvanica]
MATATDFALIALQRSCPISERELKWTRVENKGESNWCNSYSNEVHVLDCSSRSYEIDNRSRKATILRFDDTFYVSLDYVDYVKRSLKRKCKIKDLAFTIDKLELRISLGVIVRIVDGSILDESNFSILVIHSKMTELFFDKSSKPFIVCSQNVQRFKYCYQIGMESGVQRETNASVCSVEQRRSATRVLECKPCTYDERRPTKGVVGREGLNIEDKNKGSTYLPSSRQ